MKMVNKWRKMVNKWSLWLACIYLSGCAAGDVVDVEMGNGMNENKSWAFLKPGDVVDVVAPASAGLDNSDEYYQRVKHCLASIGLVARIPTDMIVIGKDPFSANSTRSRAKHLIKALTNKESKAVWAIRGGYGSAKIIPFLGNIPQPQKPKLLLGFSDITALHLFVENKWGWSSIHAPVISQLLVNPKLLDELKPIVFGEKLSVEYRPIALNKSARKAQVLNASITGGNLSLVQTSLATAWQIDAKDKIIFLEEVGEKGYRIDRMLNQLLQAGVFASAKAVVFGGITPPSLKEGEQDLTGAAVKNFAKQLAIPVLFLPTIGHDIENNSPLPLGSSCRLSLGKKPKLICLTGGE